MIQTFLKSLQMNIQCAEFGCGVTTQKAIVFRKTVVKWSAKKKQTMVKEKKNL